MSALLTADWILLDGSYYRKEDLYNMNWSVEEGLDGMLLSGAPYGGPIAMVRDRTQLVRVISHAKPIISIYNCVGNLISKIVWNSGALLQLGWSNSEQLLCVQESGDVLIYDMFGAYQRTFSMGQEARDTKVASAQIFPSPQGIGLGIMTKSNRMFLVNNVAEPKLRNVPDLPRANEAVNSWCILSTKTSVVGFLVCRDRDVFRCQPGEPGAELAFGPSASLSSQNREKDRPKFDSAYTQILCIVPSQNGRHVAMFTDSGFLYLGSSNFYQKYCEIDTGYIRRPKELIWCGSQAVIGHWENVMVVFGIRGDSVNYSYDGPFRLIPEIDCVRVVSETTHEMFQMVPAVVEKILKINSTAPGSYLMEASKQFQCRSHRAYEYISLVRPHLCVAVQDCIDAAAHELQPDTQRLLIRAAQFGKGFVPPLPEPSLTDHYVATCRKLRVLNAIRDPRVAIPLTCTQYQHLGENVLLDRLVWRRLHCLAGHIAAYLELKEGQTRVLSHWACYKVTQPHLDNESAAREIADKLRDVPGISYAAIALKAADKGRKALAIKILENETRTALQVPLLLSLGEGGAALLKATAGGDTDLLRLVLQHLEEKMGKHEFELTIRRVPAAHALYVKHCALHNREALRTVYVQEDDFTGQAATHVRDALEQSNPGSVEASLLSARECYKKGKNELAASICEDARKLCKQQSSLQETYGARFLGLSLHDTVATLLLKGEVKLADKLRAEYKMPDRRYWWLRILSLAEKREWGELDKLSKLKKSPVGYEPFVDACLKYGMNDEALKYLPRCREEIKVKYYVKAGFYEEAAKEAFEQKDLSALLFVQSKCPARDVSKHTRISALLDQLTIKK